MLLLVAFIALVAAPHLAEAQYTETLLYSFTGGTDGYYPSGPLVADAAGNFYGTTQYGGTGCTSTYTSGCGEVFELSPPSNGDALWTKTVLYSFTGGADGYMPLGGVILDAKGNLYGTTYAGGTASACVYLIAPFGCGVVFELSPPASGSGAWTETVLHTFQGLIVNDGAGPQTGLVFDSQGNLYGTTYYGGAVGCNFTYLGECGTVFELSPPSSGTGTWSEKVIYLTENNPVSSLVFDTAGNAYFVETDACYIVTQVPCGHAYKISPPPSGNGNWIGTNLHSFTNGADGGYPIANLIIDSEGNLYGTARNNALGNGVVYELSPPGSGSGSWTDTVLHSFYGLVDGANPVAPVIFDAAGNLYGTTMNGYNNYVGFGGSVYELSPPSSGTTWNETLLYEFCKNQTFPFCPDGAYPQAGVIFDAKGNIYGTTQGGGVLNCPTTNGFLGGCGVVFQLVTNKVAPAVTSWPTASTITYGQTLSASTLTGGTASVSGKFIWTAPAIIPQAGTPGESVTFIPTDTTTYTTVVGSVTVTVNQAAPTVTTWPTASALTLGQGLGSSYLTGGAASVPGRFTWTSPGIVPPAGTSSQSVSFTATDKLDYAVVTGPVSVTVVVPTLNLSATSLDFGLHLLGSASTVKNLTLTATGATVSGMFISLTGADYSFTSTCPLNLTAGNSCTLSVTFRPTINGTRAGSIKIPSNLPVSPQIVSLTGQGFDGSIIPIRPPRPPRSASSTSSTSTSANRVGSIAFRVEIHTNEGGHPNPKIECSSPVPWLRCRITPTPAASRDRSSTFIVRASVLDRDHLIEAKAAGSPEVRPDETQVLRVTWSANGEIRTFELPIPTVSASATRATD